jgi:predicted DNA-binding protein (MmcQ/YjbR family)
MDYTTARSYLLSKPEACEDFPFGPDTGVMKVKQRMFATLGYRGEQVAINLKCDPDEAIMLRDVFTAVIPGYHMNKKHWNTVFLDGSVPTPELERMIDRSYGLVVKGLKKAQREALLLSYGAAAIYR